MNAQLFSLFVSIFFAAGILAQMPDQDEPKCNPACSDSQKCNPMTSQCFTPVECNPSCVAPQHCNPVNGTCMTLPAGMSDHGMHDQGIEAVQGSPVESVGGPQKFD